MKEYQVKIVFDDGTGTISKYFNTRSEMYGFVNAMQGVYRFRAMSVAENYIVCNAVCGEFRYG